MPLRPGARRAPLRPASGRRGRGLRPGAAPQGRSRRQRPDGRDRLVRRHRRRDDRGVRPVARHQRPSKVIHVPVNGGTEPGDGSSEVALDIEVIRSVAPKARILDFEAPNDGTPFADVIDAIVDDGRAKTISISWGQCDVAGERLQRGAPGRRELLRGRRRGRRSRSYTATGDFAAYDCRANHPDDLDLTTDWPSGSQNVVAVGGTRLGVRTSGGYLVEEGWEDTLEGAGTGGGIAVREPRPSWQTGPGVDLPGAAAIALIPGCRRRRGPRFGLLRGLARHGRQPRPGVDRGDERGHAVLGRHHAAHPAGRGGGGQEAAGLPGAPALRGRGFGLGRARSTTSSAAGTWATTPGPGWDAATGLGSPDVARLLNALLDKPP